MPRRSSAGSYLRSCRLLGRPLFALTGCLALSIAPPARSQAKSDAHKQVEQLVEQNAANWKQVSQQIWDYGIGSGCIRLSRGAAPKLVPELPAGVMR
jgi:hypothetical protein